MSNLSADDITLLFASLGVLLLVARILGEVMRRMGQPSVLGELAAGILLGPTILGALVPGVVETLFPGTGPTATAFDGLTTVSIALFLLVAGLEVDLAMVWRQGKLALGVGILGIVVPFAMGFGTAAAGYALFGPEFVGMGEGSEWLVFALFVATTLSITALPVIARTLMDLDLFRTELGMVIVAAAIFNDLAGWIIFSIILGMMGGEGHGLPLWATIGATLGFTAFMLTIGRWLINRSLPWLQAHLSWPGGVLGIMIALGLLAAAFTEWIGVHAIFGAFLLGVALGDSRYLRERTRTTIEQFISFIFAPLFFASIGLRVDFVANFDVLLVVVVFVVACAGKLIGAYAAARWFGLDVRQSWVVGFGMNARGAMEIILGLLALQAGLISESLFVALVVMALATSAIAGPAISRFMAKGRAKSFTTFVGSKSFIPRLKATNRYDAIAELAEVSGIKSIPVEQVVKAVIERERVLPTGVGNELALPHARIPHLKETQVAIGISPGGIDFDSPDGSQAHIVVLTVVPADDLTTALALYREILTTFRDEDLRDDLKRVRNYTEFLALIAAFKGEQSHDEDAPEAAPRAEPSKANLTVVIGATATARQFAKVLSVAHAVWLIDSNPARVRAAQDEGLHAVTGSALEDDTQEGAHLPEASRLVALTSNADVNALALNRAREKFGTPDLFMLQHPGAEEDSHRHLQAGVIFGQPTNLTDWDHWFMHDAVEFLRIDVGRRNAAELIEELKQHGTCLAMAIEHPGKGDTRDLSPFSNAHQFAEGDVLIAARVVAGDA